MAKHIIKSRIINSSRDAIKSEDPIYKGQVASGGMVAMALLEVAEAVDRSTEQQSTKLEPIWKIRVRRRFNVFMNKMTAKL